MLAVYKYPVPIENSPILDLPQGAIPLRADMQNGSLQLWCLVNPDLSLTERRFRLAGTGLLSKRNIPNMFLRSFWETLCSISLKY